MPQNALTDSYKVLGVNGYLSERQEKAINLAMLNNVGAGTMQTLSGKK